MPKQVIPLSDAKIKSVKPKDRDYKLSDGGGLYLLIKKNGSKYWRMDYTRPITKKRATLSIGLYPDVSLKQARNLKDDAKSLIAQNIDPHAHKKKSEAERRASTNNTFESLANDFLDFKKDDYAPSTLSKAHAHLSYAITAFGSYPVNDIKPIDVLRVCKALEKQDKRDTAHAIRTKCSQVFRFGIANARCERDVTVDLRGALKPKNPTHHPAITDPKAFGKLLNDIDQYHGHIQTKLALKMLPLVFVRPFDLRELQWDSIDFEKKIWFLTPKKTEKSTGIDLAIPLSKQVLAIIEEMRLFSRNSKYVFPSVTSNAKPLSENTLNQALRRLGYTKDQHNSQGFRASARTLLDEALGYDDKLTEMQLGHIVKDVHGRAYNRTKYIEQRTEMMQAWADYCESIKPIIN